MGFRAITLASGILAVIALAAELLFAHTASITDPTRLTRFEAQAALGCGLLCAVLAMVGLVRFGLKGLWLILPAVIALALPTYAFIVFSNDFDACREKSPQAMCVP